MRFKLDENLPNSAAELLRIREHECHTVYGEALQGGPDDRLIDVCRNENRHHITLDLDFADIVTYPPEHYAGIIVLRLTRQDALFVLARLGEILETLEELEIYGHLVIVNDTRIRYR